VGGLVGSPHSLENQEFVPVVAVHVAELDLLGVGRPQPSQDFDPTGLGVDEMQPALIHNHQAGLPANPGGHRRAADALRIGQRGAPELLPIRTRVCVHECAPGRRVALVRRDHIRQAVAIDVQPDRVAQQPMRGRVGRRGLPQDSARLAGERDQRRPDHILGAHRVVIGDDDQVRGPVAIQVPRADRSGSDTHRSRSEPGGFPASPAVSAIEPRRDALPKSEEIDEVGGGIADRQDGVERIVTDVFPVVMRMMRRLPE
jgi:hypothetical protein